MGAKNSTCMLNAEMQSKMKNEVDGSKVDGSKNCVVLFLR